MANYGFPNDTPVTSADILASAREWSGTHQTDKELRDAIKSSGRIDPAFTAWCAAFMNMTLDDVGLKGTASNLAKSFLGLGVPLSTPQVGAVAVFHRTSNPMYGHVGIISKVNDDGTITVLGGNQSKSVKESVFSTDKIAGYRDVGQRAYSSFGDMTNTPSEIGAANRAQSAMRDSFRGPTDFGTPVWDGTVDDTALAAPVGRVEVASLPDIAPAGVPLGSLVSAYDFAQPGPDLGFNLSTATPSSDLTPDLSPTGATGFYGVEDPYSYGMYTPAAAPAAAPAPDLSPTGATGFYGVEDPYSYGMYSPNSYAPGPDLGANLNSAVPSSEFGMDVGPTSFSNISAGTMGQNPGFGAGITPEAPQGVNDALTIGREISVGPLGYAGTGGFGAASSTLSPNGTVLADIPSGMPSFAAVDKAMQFDPATFSYSAPAPWSDQVMGGLPDKAPATPNDLTPKDQKVDELPGYQLPPEIAPPTSLQGPSRAAPASVNVPSSSPTTRSQPSTTAVPSLSLPSLPSPINVPTLGISPSFETPASAAAGMLSGFGSPDSFLGSVMNGNMSGIGGLNTALGMDFSGMAQRAVAGDQYAQPAMLGLERAYAQATGQPGPKGLFDGLFGGWGGSPTNDGLGVVRDQATGAILGNFDPSDPQRGGFFGGLFGGGGDYGGLGTTPGAGGLY